MIGKKIKEIRRKRGMTQKELGEKVGLSESQISNIESDRKSTSLERQFKLAEVLGVHVSELYENEYRMKVDDDYLIFSKELKEQGISPEKARRWIELARKIADQEE